MLLILIASIISVMIGIGLYILAYENSEKLWSVIPLFFSVPFFILGEIALTNTVIGIITCTQQ